MNPSFGPQFLQLEYIPYFCKNPDHHFLGFSRSSQMNDQDWEQVRTCVQNLALHVCWPKIRRLVLTHSMPLFGFSLHFCDQKDHNWNTHPCVGFALSKIPNDHTQQSLMIKKANRFVIQTLFELPFRGERTSDPSLLARLGRDRINPDVPTLQDMCTEIAALCLPKAKINYLPIHLQNAVTLRQTEKQLRPFFFSWST